MYTFGYTFDAAKLELFMKVITTYLIQKYKAGVYIEEVTINGNLPEIMTPERSDRDEKKTTK